MPWIVGQRLQNGNYVIEQVLGQGGFGITYKALQVELNRSVVIKTPNEFLSHDPEYDRYVERFIKEGQILARLSQNPHPHIVGVIDLFREGATHCLVMDFVPGENLFEAVKRRGMLPEAEILPCICQIAEALTVVHKAGLVHRDAHPGNIMLRSNGKAVLIDFGIAKGIDPQTLSSTGNVGNRGFAPYEQMTRGSREPTVDIYCLAATLYYAMTGQPPTTALARKLDNASLIPPKQYNRAISERLNQAILTGMALESKDRPQSMQAWLAILKTPKVTLPPPFEPVYKKGVVRPKVKVNSEPTSPRIIPWGWLTAFFLIHGWLGFLSVKDNAPLLSLILVEAVGVAVAWSFEAKAELSAWFITVFLSSLGLSIFILINTVAVVVDSGKPWIRVALQVGNVTPLMLKNKIELRKFFSEFHTFLILTGTSCLGLGLGWLLTKVYVR
ncbi:serine/threonine protein kinase [Nostoc sp. FACHB-87]|uniref:serine/threonine protein kinase n=1 Tax=Nostocaceae TaxID=1162 RepID=UPI0016843A8E|nr:MULTISPECIES: serine/threonine-protein kinase [Nostocaceae]MBD2458674.1 serine/threonine protein kinase [Nostoc sp. FACHB-87]MBD2479699.1 serine/threonine protein kinase [Anabaena sp. FACHB-83]